MTYCRSSKMTKEVQVKGLAELSKKLESLRPQKDVFILFTGSKNESGKSWCPDCNDGNLIRYIHIDLIIQCFH